jgi:hypothetical protein
VLEEVFVGHPKDAVVAESVCDDIPPSISKPLREKTNLI